MKKPVTGYWADQLAKHKAKKEEAETDKPKEKDKQK